MFRKRRRPTPSLGINPPFNPKTGTFAPLGGPGPTPYCAMMQVIEEDTHDNYVVCRGYDPESKKFYDTINVAKPYGMRGVFVYNIAELYPAVKPTTRIGTTPGVASVTLDNPADLDETIDILLDDDSKPIWWLLIDQGASYWHYGKLDGALAASGSQDVFRYEWSGSAWVDSGEVDLVYAPPLLSSGSIATGKWVRYEWNRESARWEVVSAEC